MTFKQKKMKSIPKNKIRLIFFLTMFATLGTLFSFSSCSHEPLFDQLAEQRIHLFMRGTYSSNDPKDFTAFPASSDNDDVWDDSIPTDSFTYDRDDLNSTLRLEDLEMLKMDLSQISVINTSKDDFSIDEDDVSILSDERQLFYFKFIDDPEFTDDELYNSLDLADPELSDAEIQRKIDKVKKQNLQFFRGLDYGVEYKGGDVASGNYNKFRIFIRKIVTDKAKSFLTQDTDVDSEEDDPNNLPDEIYGEPYTTYSTYDNDDEPAYEISQMYRFLDDEVTGSQTKNYLFPLTMTKSFNIPSKGPVHIEFRFFIKNNMRLYEGTDYSGEENVRFWAFSDYASNYDYKLYLQEGNRTMLGNFKIAMRVYNPFEVGTIQGTLSSCTTSGDLDAECYVAAVPSGREEPSAGAENLPELATGTAVGGVYTLKNVAPGTYDVYLMQDVDNSAGTGTRDGFPETRISGPVTVTVSKDQTAIADL